jgi:hypothetical protein
VKYGRHVARAAAATVLALCVVTVAWAYLTTTGVGIASGSVSALTAPTISSAIPGSGTVALTWTAVAPPGSGTVTYYVTRDGGAPGGNCPSSSSPSAGTSCTDGGVSIATHQYRVTAVWRTWTATSSATAVQVTIGAPARLVLSAATTSPGVGSSDNLSLAAATTTPTAGAADNLTTTAQDTYGNTATTYTGSHNLTFSGASTIGTHPPTVTTTTGTATNFGTATAITFTNGVATVTGSNNGVMTLYKAETAQITVTDATINNNPGLTVTVAVAASRPSGLAYVDQALVIADQVTGTTSANVGVTATETQGDQVGNVYTATSNGSGGFTINVEAYNGLLINRTFTYSVTATDAYGNLTVATTVTANDAR